MNKISILTAYDFNTARALEQAGIDYILVGDSLAMVGFGYSDTKKINFGQMLAATRAVRRGAAKTKIITDLPYCEIIKNSSEVVKAAQQVVKAGANIVKIENAETKTIQDIKALREAQIEVMGHIGYTPQSLDKAKLIKDKDRLIEEAKNLEQAGVMGIVLEMVRVDIAQTITENLSVPTIGIGAGPHCKGQVLVSDDMLGRYNLLNPKFLRKYANQYDNMVKAFSDYIDDVKNFRYPNLDESYL